jgi:RNA 2',3'-cyclic 3'-phosphodiesterase
MRLFLAIELSDAARRHLVQLQQKLKPIAPASYTKPENLHLTLKFLGEVPDDRVKGICDALSAIPQVGSFDLAADHLVCFPEHKRIRIIAAGMPLPPQLCDLVNHIEDACATLGFAREDRPFSAHVTLARARQPLPTPLRPELANAAADAWPGPSFHIAQFVLMQSVLQRQGAEYVPAARIYI